MKFSVLPHKILDDLEFSDADGKKTCLTHSSARMSQQFRNTQQAANSKFWHQVISNRKKDLLFYSTRSTERKIQIYCQMLHVAWAMLVKFSPKKKCLCDFQFTGAARECVAPKHKHRVYFLTLLDIGNGGTCRQIGRVVLFQVNRI